MIVERLETDRLLLRRPVPADMGAYQTYYASDWRATHGPVVAPRQSRDRFEAILAHWQQKGFGRFVIERRDAPGGIGLIGPHFPDSFIEPEITWQLWQADVAGHGFAHEAATAARAHAFDTLGWTTAVTYIHAENRNAIQLALRMGASLDPEATYPASIGPHDVYRHPGPVRAESVLPVQTRRKTDGAGPPTLRTPRFLLRPYNLDDFGAYAAHFASAHAPGSSAPVSRDTAWNRFANDIAHWPLFGYGGLTIEVDGQPAGFVRITSAPGSPEPELGWSLYDGFRGKGVATGAAMTLRDYAYMHAGLTSLVSYCDPDDTSSIRVAERLGCKPDPDATGPVGVSCLVYRHPAADADGNPEAYA
ncbi:GNAT family N-acetyltransferase [Tropicimonas marinistellae]|uniref:GNAT family N-acetyltransferase n=1 Tax=Tropicimonas marinistellae TaxID=1739787 RepID=UPI0008367BCC|nr:GNAT family N-acetyltransferase [Tropicimonas marinistellae]